MIRHASLQTKITLCILLAVLIPLGIIAIGFSGTLHSMMIADTIRSEQDRSSEIVPQLNDQLETLDECKQDIMSQPYYQTLFSRRIDSSWSQLASSQEAAEFQTYIDELCQTTCVQAVCFYMDGVPDSFYSAESSLGLFRSDDAMVPVYWHGIFSGNSSVTEWYCSDFYLSSGESSNLGDAANIYRISYNYQDRVGTAYLAIYYSADVYRELLEKELQITGSVSYLIDQKDTIIATTDKALSGQYYRSYQDVEDMLMASNSFLERQVQGKNVYVASYRIQQSDWFLVTVIPEDPLIAAANQALFKFALLCLGCVLIAVFVAIQMARSITRRIAAVAAQMEKVHEGPPKEMPSPEVHDEVGDLTDSYNYMTREMNHLIEEQQKTAEELRISEFNVLQAQINPHFLYNTMDMINWMAVQGKNLEVSETVQKLSRFYKLTLSRKKKYSTITDELEHASIYVQLQNMRFNNGIDLVIDVPDELTEYRIPRLTFQPILENSILHGILEKEDKTGTILITAWTEEDDINILISDDGVGVEPDILPDILSENRTKINSAGTNIAIVNIHKRLKLLYGDRYGLSYSSVPGEGCEVTIRIPKHYGDTPYVRK